MVRQVALFTRGSGWRDTDSVGRREGLDPEDIPLREPPPRPSPQLPGRAPRRSGPPASIPSRRSDRS